MYSYAAQICSNTLYFYWFQVFYRIIVKMPNTIDAMLVRAIEQVQIEVIVFASSQRRKISVINGMTGCSLFVQPGVISRARVFLLLIPSTHRTSLVCNAHFEESYFVL